MYRGLLRACAEVPPWTLAARAGASSGVAALLRQQPCRQQSAVSAASAADGETFVSAHFRLDASAVHGYLERRGLAYRDTPTHTIVRGCPLCGKPHGDRADNLWKLYIRRKDGAYFCHRCGAGGSWYDFKRKLGDGPAEGALASAGAARSLLLTEVGGGGAPAVAAAAALAAAIGGAGASAAAAPRAGTLGVDTDFAMRASRELLDEGKFPDVLQYLTAVRGLTPATLRHYCVGAVMRDVPVTASAASASAGTSASAGAGLIGDVGGGLEQPRRAGAGSAVPVAWEKHACIVFPWLAPRADAPAGATGAAAWTCSRVKLRSMRDKAVQMLLPRGGAGAILPGACGRYRCRSGAADPPRANGRAVQGDGAGGAGLARWGGVWLRKHMRVGGVCGVLDFLG